MPGTLDDPKVIRDVLTRKPRVAMIGASSKPEKASHEVLAYLVDHGFEVVPVNPKEEEILGLRCYPSLEEVPGEVEVVDVFRKPEALGPIAEAAIRKGARVLWMQLGIVNEEAAQRAREAGLDVVMDHCMKQEHARLEREGRAEPRA